MQKFFKCVEHILRDATLTPAQAAIKAHDELCFWLPQTEEPAIAWYVSELPPW